jgi:capsular exopolysaccharide synthesis family protein
MNDSNSIQPQFAITGKKNNIKELLLKYLSFWPLFIIFIAVSIFIGYTYLRYAIPKYMASAKILISDKSMLSADRGDLVTEAVFGARPTNMSNELQFMQSGELIKEVVKKKELNITYSISGTIKTVELYKTSPIKLVPLEIYDSASIKTFKITAINKRGGVFEISPKKHISFYWDSTITWAGIKFVLKRLNPLLRLDADKFITIRWMPPAIASYEFQRSLKIIPFSNQTTIISLQMPTATPRKATDFLDGLIDEFIEGDIRKKKEYALKLIQFIDERLVDVTNELDSIETEMMIFRQKNRFLSVSSEFGYLQGKVMPVEGRKDDMELNIKLIGLLEDYLNTKANKDKLLPSTLGLGDNVLNLSIGEYNNLQRQKDLVINSSTKKGVEVAKFNEQLQEIKGNILISLKNLRDQYNFRLNDDSVKIDYYLGKEFTVPEKLRMEEAILRRKTLKQDLFNYLQRKKEETEISSASTKSNYEKMDPAVASGEPFTPKVGQIKMMSVLFGFLFPVLLIYIIDLLNDKVKTKDDILNNTNLPIVGEINHATSIDEVVIKNSRSIISEQFRVLRSNLQYFAGDHPIKTILVTSSISGEGKSFISLNLACVLSVTAKKVALLEFDLRKLKSLKTIGNENIQSGITNYLINQISDPIEIARTIPDYPHLHIFNTGHLPPNPAELIISDRTKLFMDWLKANYDYIIIDSAPVGLVSDSFALADYSDITLYILRQRYTHKKQLDFINKTAIIESKLKKVALVVNDLKIKGRHGYYGYAGNYGDGYYYGYKYKGHGYYTQEKEINFWKRIKQIFFKSKESKLKR